MTDVVSFWLPILGAVTGSIGMATGFGAVIYARRQAIAAEGPTIPDTEIKAHGWDKDNDGWYSVHILVRNRTNIAWNLSDAELITPRSGKIISQHERPSTGPAYNPNIIPLNDIQPSTLNNRTSLMSSVEALGGNDWAGRPGNSVYTTLHIKVPQISRSISIRFTFEDKAAIARQRKITLKRRLEPNTITPV